jgi:outer membrane lipoprotein
MRVLIILFAILALTACTTVPEQIQGNYPEISPARVDRGVFGTSVRWGGVIVSSKVKDDMTCFEILSRDLDKYLRPKIDDSTAGRFIACKPGFHDPMVFAAGRELTVTGEIESIEVRKLEEFDYRYPVVAVDDLVLWQKRKVIMRYRGFYDPWYGPWYGSRYGWGGRGGYWGAYPYYRGPYGSGYVEPEVVRPDPAVVE